MLLLISPAKTLDFDTAVPAPLARRASEPLFTGRAAELIGVLRRKKAAQVAALMELSDSLAQLNVQRCAAWSPVATPANSRPAAWAFAGDVYAGLQAQTMKAADWTWAQQHLVILSGLYGVLRPLDRLQPYRLEMGTALAVKGAGDAVNATKGGTKGATKAGTKDLYGYWGDTIAEHLNERQAGERAPVIVNLASIEYARAALRTALRARVVDCVFEEWKGGGWKIVSFFAKRARGLMARHAIDRRARTPAQLEDFAAEGYALDRGASEPDRLVFRRHAAP